MSLQTLHKVDDKARRSVDGESLAEESQEQASRIEETVDKIQYDAENTVESLESANKAIGTSTGEVTTVLMRLKDIAGAISEATGGIQEVSRAMDEQAASTEEITSMVDELATQSDALASEIDTITEANRAQRCDIGEVAQAVRRLTDENSSDY